MTAGQPNVLATATPSASPSPTDPPTTEVNAVVARDPFEVLYPDGSSGDGDGTGTGTGTGTSTSTDDGTGTGFGYQPGKGSSTSDPSGSTAAADSTRHSTVKLIGSPTNSGTTYSATLRVDGSAAYTVKVGEAFADTLRLRSVHSDMTGALYATVQYRGATPIDVPIGHTVRLQG